MNTSAKSFEIYWKDEKIGEVTSFDVEGTDIEAHVGETLQVSGTIDLDVIEMDWDETWLVAYMGRMYASYFKN